MEGGKGFSAYLNRACTPVILITVLIALLSSCSEFIEPSLTRSEVKLLAPADGSESGSYRQNFWWEEVSGASGYRLQIVAPSFSNVNRLLLDSLVKRQQFSFTLEPGTYEWRVRAENGSSKSPYSSGKFVIHISSIKSQQVQVTGPANNSLTNLPEALYRWEKLYGATRYRLQLDTNNFEDESRLLFNNSTPNLEYNVSFIAEKTYRWRVRAENDTAQSVWSVISKITFDKTPPGQVTLTSPANEQVIGRPVPLKWSEPPGVKRYELLVLRSDSVTAVNTTFPVALTTAGYSFNLGDFNEKFYWKVRAVD